MPCETFFKKPSTYIQIALIFFGLAIISFVLSVVNEITCHPKPNINQTLAFEPWNCQDDLSLYVILHIIFYYTCISFLYLACEMYNHHNVHPDLIKKVKIIIIVLLFHAFAIVLLIFIIICYIYGLIEMCHFKSSTDKYIPLANFDDEL